MEPAVIDMATWAELRDAVGAEFAAELVDTFLEETPAILAEMRAAVDAPDPDRYRRAAHSLKANGATFGALGFAATARAAELDGLTADTVAAAAAVDALDAEYVLVAAALAELTHE